MNGIMKAANIAKMALDETELAAINQYTMRALTPEDVFVFRVAACGNEIDRDFEAFSRKALEELAPMMEGKTILVDHRPTTDGQKARIYRASVEDGKGTTRTGEPYARLVLSCYMARTDSNRDYIAEIEAGIKREVSVGCAMAAATCSVCGKNNVERSCNHVSGQMYGAKLCYRTLENPTDAYEVSFVAVPAQPEAGVIKNYGGKPEAKPENKPKTVAEKIAAAYKKKAEE